LLERGEESGTNQLLRRFLGREVSPQALLEELRRIGPSTCGTLASTSRSFLHRKKRQAAVPSA